MSALQHRLSQFLELELHHSLGAYRHARDQLRELEKRLEEDRELTSKPKPNADFLLELTGLMRTFNHELDEKHDAAPDADVSPETLDNAIRHPPPPNAPLCAPEGGSGKQCKWVEDFYTAAVDALSREDAGDLPPDVAELQRVLVFRRVDQEQSAFDLAAPVPPVRRRRRRTRFEDRLAEARAAGLPGVRSGPVLTGGESVGLAQQLVHSHLGARDPEPLGPVIVQALVDGHFALHEAEHRASRPLGAELTKRDETRAQAERALNRSIVLNTFVWSASRVAPWAFAEDDEEREYMVRYYPRVWRHHMPMRAMWISAQVSLLALHRRAYARGLRGDHAAAYRDYHKLQRHVRETARRLRLVPLHVDGSLEFLDGLDALADQHIGELYRLDRDHTSALRHFNRANDRLQLLKQARGESLITNSRWYVQLQFGLGKSSYELGRHKRCLLWYLRTWRALMDLIAADSGAEADHEPIDYALEWLLRILDEADLHKRDLLLHIQPVVARLEAYRVDPRFRALASDVLLKLGHLLLVLNLGEQRARDIDVSLSAEREQPPAPPQKPTEPADPQEPKPTADEGLPELRPPLDATLALRCVRRAWQLDPKNTLADTDLLKLYFRATRNGPPTATLADAIVPKYPLAEHWPRGATELDGMFRAIEYLLLQQLSRTRNADAARSTGGDPKEVETEEETLARELLHSFLTHTDSIEARKTQVYDYLTKPPTSRGLSGAPPALEFVCLRRYSSAYPILPRPRAFRADGGGYFVRAYASDGPSGSFGIAVDPGTSYVECLYRAGFALSDIDMVIVTHDHVDHASSLEPMLALRHEMRQIGMTKRLLVAGNRSVMDRWSQIESYRSADDGAKPGIEFLRLDDPEQLDRLNQELREHLSRSPDAAHLTIEPLPSDFGRPPDPETGRSSGHNDLSGNPSVGIVLSLHTPGQAARRLALTSDLPAVPAEVDWPDSWRRALAADALVCHVSTVPMSELRKMARLELPSDELLRRDIAWLNESYEHGHLRDRLAYASWLQGAEGTEVYPVGDARRLEDWVVPSAHPYLGGLLRLAYAFRDAVPDPEHDRVLVIGELSEELGSFRSKIAVEINRGAYAPGRGRNCCRAVTSDIGLRVSVEAGEPEHQSARQPVRVMCSGCELDNDLAPIERFHSPRAIAEVCVKGENEGIFYYCTDHGPMAHPRDPTFIEKHERYDVFGR